MSYVKKDWERKQAMLAKLMVEMDLNRLKNYKMKTVVSLARFATLANRHVTMRAESSIVVQSEPHPDSGEVCSVTLRYDGDGYVLDGSPLMKSPRPSMSAQCPWQASVVSGGCLPWKESAAAAMALLAEKTEDAARAWEEDDASYANEGGEDRYLDAYWESRHDYGDCEY